MVPEDLRVPSRGRVASVVEFMFSSPSEFEVEVWLDSVLGREEGSAIDGMGLLRASEVELVGAMVGGREVNGAFERGM